MTRKAYASVAVPRIYEDLPDLTQQAIAQGIFTGRTVSNSILMATLQGPLAAADSVRRHTRRSDYFYGPTTVVSSLQVFPSEDIWQNFLVSKYPGVTGFFLITQSLVQEIGDRGLSLIHI